MDYDFHLLFEILQWHVIIGAVLWSIFQVLIPYFYGVFVHAPPFTYSRLGESLKSLARCCFLWSYWVVDGLLVIGGLVIEGLVLLLIHWLE